MKTLSLCLLFPALSPSFAMAEGETNYVGNFSEAHTVTVIGYDTEEKCKADQGKWSGEYCEFDAANTVKISKNTEGNSKAYKASIEVVGTNFHSCSYEGDFTVIPGNRLVSVTWPNGETNPSCKVLLRFLPPSRSEQVEVTHMGDGCSYYCGARVGLNIGSATRIAE